MNKVYVEQTLHGYSNGHRLLAASLQLSDEEQKKMVALSDMAGNEFVRDDLLYYTGYSLSERELVLACTWYAHEMTRPGCVWTHSLIFSKDDLQNYDFEMGTIFSLFKRPEMNMDISYYCKKLEFDKSKSFRVNEKKLKYLIWCIWGNKLPLVIFANDEANYDQELIYIYMMQQAILKSGFSFCTGTSNLRKIYQNPMDLQITSHRMVKSNFELENGVTKVRGEETIKDYPIWINRTAEYMIRDNLKEFKKFVAIFPKECDYSMFLSCFMKVYIGSEAVNHNLNLYKMLNMVIAVFGSNEKICNTFAIRYCDGYFKAWTGKEEYCNILKFIIEYEWLTIPEDYERHTVILGIQNEYEQMQDFLTYLIDSEENVAIRILSEIAKYISVESFAEFTGLKYENCSAMITLNVKFAKCRELWKQRQGFQQGIIKCLDKENVEYSVNAEIIKIILTESPYDFAKDLYKIYGNICIDIFWNEFWQINDKDKRAGIKKIIGKDSKRCVKVLKNNLTNWKKVIDLLEIINPYDVAVKDITSAELTKLFYTFKKNSNSVKEHQIVAQFFIALCFNEDYILEKEIAKFAYKETYNMLAKQSFPETEWEKLEVCLPEVAWYNKWDRCKRLKKGLKKRGYSSII